MLSPVFLIEFVLVGGVIVGFAVWEYIKVIKLLDDREDKD